MKKSSKKETLNKSDIVLLNNNHSLLDKENKSISVSKSQDIFKKRKGSYQSD